jgi:adenosylcobinamide-phosphate synthase
MEFAIYLPALLIAAAIALDLMLGDPWWLPHPVRLIGALVARGERALYRGEAAADVRRGALLAAGAIGAAALATFALIALAAWLSTWLAAIVAVAIAWTTLAFRGLDEAALRVQRHLASRDLVRARAAMPALVGRDPDALDRGGMIRATIESVAENASDAVIAPLFYLFLGGPVLAVAYKAINTLDSMIGYDDERYRHFGRVAARIDDVANYVPARLTAALIAASAHLMMLRGRRALEVCFDDAHKHASPNAGWPEAAMAGALGVRLGGRAVYGGEVVERAVLGRDEVPIAIETIAAARELLRAAMFLGFCVLALIRYVALTIW